MQSIKLLERATGGKDEVGEGWMPASGGRNFILDDPALTFLDFHADQVNLKEDSPEYSFFNFICQKGVAFERKWTSEMFPHAVQLMENDFDVRKKEAFQRTLEAIDRKEKVMTKVALWWKPAQVFGSCDVLIISTALYKKFPQLKPTTPEAPHYCVIDLKLGSRLEDKPDALHIASNQVKIYSYIVGHLQGYMPKRAYLFTRDHIFDPIVVDLDDLTLNKPMPAELQRHRRDYSKIKIDGKDLRPWEDELVKPNFGNKMDAPWTGAKKEIEEERIPGRSLTMLPGVGPTLSDAIKKKLAVKSLDDLLAVKPESLPLEEVDGIGETVAKRIRAVLKANRSRKPTPVLPEFLPPRVDLELYVDFETFNNLNIDFDKQWPTLEGCQMIWAIGVHCKSGRTWKHTQFVASSESHAAEKKILRDFMAFLTDRGAFDPNKSVAIYHWTAEPTMAKQAAERHGIKRLLDLPFVDLYKVFADSAIGIPNAWDYTLKSIATGIGKYDPRFRSEWRDVASGSQAMVMAWAAYSQPNPAQSLEMKRLQSYLKTDVMAIWQVHRWLKDAALTERTASAFNTQTTGWYSASNMPVRLAQSDTVRTSGWYGSQSPRWQ